MSFRTTRWSLVRRATAHDATGRAALDELCALYWPPVYGYLRRHGLDRAAAEDQTQALFARLLERRDLDRVDPERGRFRSWLKSCARHAASNVRAAEQAERRGGGRSVLSIDAARLDQADGALEPASGESPEATFDRLWALAVLDRAWSRLRAEQVERGRGELFDALRPWLEGAGGAAPYPELAQRFASSEGALKVAVHRWRQRLRELLVAEVRDTLPDDEDGVDELGELLTALGGPG